MLDGRIQEIDIDTGDVVFEWSAADHVPAEHTFQEIAPDDHAMGTHDAPFDWLHLNTVTEDDDGNLILSARNTHAIYKLDKWTGELVWTLGGMDSDFEMGEGTEFAWQHDAQRSDDRTLVIGWDQEPYFSEYTNDGELILDASHGGDGSYRSYRLPWEGRPTTEQDVVVRDYSVFVSWKGATEVAQWRVVAGEDEASVGPVVTVERDGFETEIPREPGVPYVTVETLDDNGQVLATGTLQA